MKSSPKIDFYLIEHDTEQSRFLFACRLAEKAYQHQHQLYIHVPTAADGKVLDDLLWTYRDASFIPHALYHEDSNPLLPIQIGHQTKFKGPFDILLNLADVIPEFFENFQRIIEIVTPTSRFIGREHYRYYRELSLNLKTHKIPA